MILNPGAPISLIELRIHSERSTALRQENLTRTPPIENNMAICMSDQWRAREEICVLLPVSKTKWHEN